MKAKPLFRIVLLPILLLALGQHKDCLGANLLNVPADYTTIQSAIDSSSDGDTVLVQPGTYVENINFNGKNIVLESLFLTTGDTSYISQTIIDANEKGSAVVFENNEDSSATLIGFSIMNGLAEKGGGIFLSESNATIKNMKILSNKAFDSGGGISVFRRLPNLQNILVKLPAL